MFTFLLILHILVNFGKIFTHGFTHGKLRKNILDYLESREPIFMLLTYSN